MSEKVVGSSIWITFHSKTQLMLERAPVHHVISGVIYQLFVQCNLQLKLLQE